MGANNELIKFLKQLQKSLPIIYSPELSSSVHWTPSEDFPVHRWFRYREGFSPYLLDYFPEAKNRLDPFCGCGTTLLESARRGIHSCGIDLNPLATFVAKVKTQQYSGMDKVQFISLSEQALKKTKNIMPFPKPKYELLDKLFLEESLFSLLQIKSFIISLPNDHIRDLLFLAWLSILEKSSNVFKEGNGLKYRNKKRKPGKYETIPIEQWRSKYFGNDIRYFIEHLWKHKCQQISEDIESFRFAPGYTPIIRTGTCLNAQTLDFDRTFDFVIFSPPYANRFDYFESFKIELWLGGFVNSSEDINNLRSDSMRNNLTAARFDSNEKWDKLIPFLYAMDPEASSVRMGIKNTLEGYFYDMRKLLKMLKRHLVRKGKVVIVVGNSAYAKSIIPTDILIAYLGIEENYNVKSIRIARNLHVSSQQRLDLAAFKEYMRESVIILEKR